MSSETAWLTLSLTNRCPLQCAHCGPRSGPAEHGTIDQATVNDALDVARARRFAAVNLTGGEPFILGPALEPIVRAVTARGLWSRITTGGFWAATLDAARRRMAPLAAAGLNEICLSCSEEHQEFVPFENLVNAVRASREHFVNTAINLGLGADSPLSEAGVQERFRIAGAPIPKVFRSKLIPFGRAAESLPVSRQALRPVAELDGPCPSLTVHPTIFNDGAVAGCASVFSRDCRPLHFGNVHQEPLERILDRMDSHPLSFWIHRQGVVKLKQLIEANSPLRFADRYVNICHLCGDLLSHTEALRVLNRLGIVEDDRVVEAGTCG